MFNGDAKSLTRSAMQQSVQPYLHLDLVAAPKRKQSFAAVLWTMHCLLATVRMLQQPYWALPRSGQNVGLAARQLCCKCVAAQFGAHARVQPAA
jgi:hypothetical protein